MPTQTALLLLRAAGEVRSIFAAQAADRLTLPQAVALLAICDNPGLKQHELFAITGSDRTTTSAMLQRMERAGWVVLTRDPEDMRAVRVTPTRSGKILRTRAEYALAKTSATIAARVLDGKILCNLLTKAVTNA